MKRNFADFNLDDAGYHGAAGDCLSACGDCSRATALSATGQWRTDSAARRNSSGIKATRAAVCFSGIFSFEAIRCRACRLRSDGFGRIESRTDQQGADRPRRRRRAIAFGRKSGRTNPRRPRNRIGLRTRSAHFSRVGRFSSSTRGARTRDHGRRSARARGKTHGATAVRISWRAARERTRAQSRAGCGSSVALTRRGIISPRGSHEFSRPPARSDTRSMDRCGCSADAAGPARFFFAAD